MVVASEMYAVLWAGAVSLTFQVSRLQSTGLRVRVKSVVCVRDVRCKLELGDSEKRLLSNARLLPTRGLSRCVAVSPGRRDDHASKRGPELDAGGPQRLCPVSFQAPSQHQICR
eukprot:1948956-Rhodomonas_salina.2